MIWPNEKPKNDVDTIPTYASGTPEREKLLKALEKVKKDSPVEIPLIINGKEVKTDIIYEVRAPHDKDLLLARAHLAGEDELKEAIDAALAAHEEWANIDWYHRVAVFKKAADLLSGPRRTENTALIMMNQSKNPYEAEIDLAELVDFWRYNAYYARMIYEMQPGQYHGELNRMDWRPLEGFILAVPPFNFYSIAGNLPTAPAIVGNVSLWKPSRSVILSNYGIMRVLMEAGVPPGVINFVPFSSKHSDVIFNHPDFAGLHFTGSYETLVTLWNKVGANLEKYRNFPRIVGETGGKDFIFAHESADPRGVAINIIRGGFGYQGQKCSAVSRVYIPEGMWPEVKSILDEEVPKLTMGPTDDLNNYMGAVIDETAFKKITGYIDYAKEHPDEYEILFGGNYDSSKGWFVEPTIVKTSNPKGKLMTEEIFGPVVTIYTYPDEKYEETLKLCDETSPYGLTGSIFAQDRYAVIKAEKMLRYSAGNFYINDKPTGAIVDRQPFGGARASGTDDKAGSFLNIIRWMLPRTIKETSVLPMDWRRPFMD